jgi:hypothetical protein
VPAITEYVRVYELVIYISKNGINVLRRKKKKKLSRPLDGVVAAAIERDDDLILANPH